MIPPLIVGLTERYLLVRLAGGDALKNTFPEVRVARTGLGGWTESW